MPAPTLAHILAKRGLHGSGVDQLGFSLAAFFLFIGQNPDVCADAGIIEHILWHGDNGFNQIVLNQIAPGIALAAARISGKDG